WHGDLGRWGAGRRSVTLATVEYARPFFRFVPLRKRYRDWFRSGIQGDEQRALSLAGASKHIGDETTLGIIPVVLAHLICIRGQPFDVVAAVLALSLQPAMRLKLRIIAAQSHQRTDKFA